MEQITAKKRKKKITTENSNPYHTIILPSDFIRYYGYVLGREIGKRRSGGCRNGRILYQIGLVFDKRDNHRYYGIGITQYRG